MRYYQRLRQMTGKNEDELALPDQEGLATISDLLTELAKQHPELEELIPTLCFARNGDFAPAHQRIADGDTIDIMPPFCGG